MFTNSRSIIVKIHDTTNMKKDNIATNLTINCKKEILTSVISMDKGSNPYLKNIPGIFLTVAGSASVIEYL